MNSTKTIYWVALAAFAVTFGNQYQHGKFERLHRLADRAELRFCHFASQAEQTLAMARVLIGKDQHVGVDDQLALKQAEVDRAMAEHQAEIESAMAMRQADLDRMLAERQADLNRAMALRQADLDRVQRQVDRVRVVIDRAQMQKVRALARNAIRVNSGNRHVTMVCPFTGQKISVNAHVDLPEVNADVDIPSVEVGDDN